MSSPLPKGENGERDARGRFTKGNAGGPGNPFAKRTSEFRKAFLNVVSPSEFGEVVSTVLAKAKAGDMAAAKLIIDRLLGTGQVAPSNSLSEIIESIWE